MKIRTSKSDVIWSYLGYGLNLAINVILLPWILKSVEQTELGVWYTFASVATLVNTVDFGFSPTILRNLTYVWSGAKTLQKSGVQYIEKDAKTNYTLYNKVLTACRYLYLIISLIALLILATVGTVYIKSISAELGSKALIAWGIYTLGCFMNLYYSYWPLTLKSIGRVGDSQKATVASKAVQFLISLIGLELGRGIIALAIAYVAGGIVLRLYARHFFMKQPEIKEHIGGKSEKFVQKEIYGIFGTLWFNAKKAGISTISTTVMTQSGTLMCSAYLGVKATAEYGLAFQLVTVLVGVGQIMYQIKLPVITNAKAVNDIERQQKEFSLSVVCYFLITVIGSICCAAFLGEILATLKSNTAFNALLFLGIAAYYIPENNYSIHAGYISTGNELPFVKSLVFTAIARVLLLFLFIRVLSMDTPGIVLAGVVSDFAYIVWKWPMVALKQLQLNPFSLTKIGIAELLRTIKTLFSRRETSE